jgi:hypothetical protein
MCSGILWRATAEHITEACHRRWYWDFWNFSRDSRSAIWNIHAWEKSRPRYS